MRTHAAQIFKEAQDLLPGGVNSPVRAFKSVGGNPIIFESVKGPYAFDVDGNKCAPPSRLAPAVSTGFVAITGPHAAAACVNDEHCAGLASTLR